MGLDMYLNGEICLSGVRQYENAMRGEPREVAKRYELGYWRKHPNLHGYIVSNFAEEDNCQPISLSEEELLQIIEAVKNKELPETKGFFFGESENNDAQQREDITVLQGALDWLNTNKDDSKSLRYIYYRASW